MKKINELQNKLNYSNSEKDELRKFKEINEKQKK